MYRLFNSGLKVETETTLIFISLNIKSEIHCCLVSVWSLYLFSVSKLQIVLTKEVQWLHYNTDSIWPPNIHLGCQDQDYWDCKISRLSIPRLFETMFIGHWPILIKNCLNRDFLDSLADIWYYGVVHRYGMVRYGGVYPTMSVYRGNSMVVPFKCTKVRHSGVSPTMWVFRGMFLSPLPCKCTEVWMAWWCLPCPVSVQNYVIVVSPLPCNCTEVYGMVVVSVPPCKFAEVWYSGVSPNIPAKLVLSIYVK